MLIRILEIIAVVLAAAAIITQILVPLWQNRPTFPIFRRGRKLEKQIADLNEESLEQQLEREIAAKQAVLHPKEEQSTPPHQS